MAATQIPVFDLSEQALNLEESSPKGWKSLCDGIREACEEFGCFLVTYDRVPMHLYDEVFKTIQSLFALPIETKEKTPKSLYSAGYQSKLHGDPLFQSLCVDNVPELDAIKAFTDLMWPQGNPDACRTIHSMAAKLRDLHKILIRMIFQSLGVEQYLASHLESDHGCFRLMHYDPPQSPDWAKGFGRHVDFTVLSIVGENELPGVKLLTRRGDWIQVQPRSKGTFLVFVGASLEVMSNGRFQSPEHEVGIAGDRVRYSYGMFTSPQGRTMVEAFNELVDKDHPLRYRPFYYEDYMQHYINTGYVNSVKDYAGI